MSLVLDIVRHIRPRGSRYRVAYLRSGTWPCIRVLSSTLHENLSVRPGLRSFGH